MENFTRINEAPCDQRVHLFLTRLKQCEQICDFSDPRLNFALKEAKRRHLIDLMEYVALNRAVFNDHTYLPFISMVSANIFRPLPVTAYSLRNYEPDEEDGVPDPAWPHLQIVYELFRRFVVSADTDSKRARACINVHFVTQIIELFKSEDPREREYLKTILHRIYGKFMPLRAPIRKVIMNVFHRVVYEMERHSGIAELLEILGSIINGFAVPLKEEHKYLLRKGLLPLHIPAAMPSYHEQLSFCVAQFVQKDLSLAAEVLHTLIKNWPCTHSRKEVLLLIEVEEVIELTPPEDLEKVVDELFKRIGRCIESAHFQVAERALFYWNNEAVVRLMVYYLEQVMRSVVGPLQQNAKSHWNANVCSLSKNIQQLLQEMDSNLFDRGLAQYEQDQREKQKQDADRARMWRAVYRMAQERGINRSEIDEKRSEEKTQNGWKEGRHTTEEFDNGTGRNTTRV